MSSEIETAAKEYIKKGWVPLAQDDRKPIASGYNRLNLSDPKLYKQGWKRASGIGLLTGNNSGGLAALDIDDTDFATSLFAKLARSGKAFRWHWSRSGAGHLLVREVEPTYGGPRTVTWEGRDIHIDLKCNFHGANGEMVGASLTAPPTPGYVLTRDVPPQPVETLENALQAVCLAMGAYLSPQIQRPEPWQDYVGDGSKNDSLYSEARALAMARMPYERAVEILKLNTELTYARDVTGKEFIDTIRSAYRRFWKTAEIANDPRYVR